MVEKGSDLPSVKNSCDTAQNIRVTVFSEREQIRWVPWSPQLSAGGTFGTNVERSEAPAESHWAQEERKLGTPVPVLKSTISPSYADSFLKWKIVCKNKELGPGVFITPAVSWLLDPPVGRAKKYLYSNPYIYIHIYSWIYLSIYIKINMYLYSYLSLQYSTAASLKWFLYKEVFL